MTARRPEPPTRHDRTGAGAGALAHRSAETDTRILLLGRGLSPARSRELAQLAAVYPGLVWNGKVTLAAARTRYGVAVDAGGAVDAAATKRLRQARNR